MLMKEVTPKMIKEWKAIHSEYRNKLHPNRKTAQEIIDYLRQNYPVIELSDKTWEQVVIDDVLMNEHSAEKLPNEKGLKVTVFKVLKEDLAKILYQEQDEVFSGMDIIVGIELETGFFHVEGSSRLWEELFAFRGLDESDLKNHYLVAEYITCLKTFDKLDEIAN